MEIRHIRRTTQLAGAGLLTAAAMAPWLTAPAPASASVTVTSHFIWTATSSNTAYFASAINNAATNGLPHALLFVTPNNAAGGVCGCVSDPAPIAVTYGLLGGNRWSIINEDESNIPLGAQFNVLVVQAPSASVFVQHATTANTSGYTTTIDATSTNGKAGALLQVTQVDNEASGPLNPHAIGVTYANNRAAIFNEDQSAIPIGAQFNVMVGSAKSNGGRTHLQQTLFGSGSDSVINYSGTNGNPNAVVLETPNFDTPYIGGVYDASATGVTYVGSPTDEWAVTQEDGSSMGNGPAFNLLVFPS